MRGHREGCGGIGIAYEILIVCDRGASLHSRKHDEEVQLYAFDILALDGDDLRQLPLHLHKNNLAQLLRGRAQGIFVAPFEQGEIRPSVPDGLQHGP